MWKSIILWASSFFHKDERKGIALVHKVGLGSQHCLNETSWYILSLWTYFIFNAEKDSLVLCQPHEIQFLNFTVIYNGEDFPWHQVHSWDSQQKYGSLFVLNLLLSYLHTLMIWFKVQWKQKRGISKTLLISKLL